MNPKYPVHVISGSAGMKAEGTFVDPPPDWLIKRSYDINFTLMEVKNKFELEFKQFSVDQKAVIDRWTVKKSHKNDS